jgi:transcriptional regulator with XRE-family HTH domain
MRYYKTWPRAFSRCIEWGGLEKSCLTLYPLASLMGMSTRTLQDWEQGRRKPTGAAQTLLRVAIAHPEALLDLKAA